MVKIAEGPPRPWTADLELLRCVHCRGPLTELETGLRCSTCGVAFPIRDGVLVIQERASEDNKIAQEFYNGALWPKFRFWERLFWLCNGGERRSRELVLRHLPKKPSIRLLDIAIGDGVYTGWLPGDWSIVGVDISEAQLSACQANNVGRRDLRLILGEAESLPFHDHRFDAVLSMGGFNHFNDPEHALREMVRLARPDAPIIVSDEIPDLPDRMPGHRLGWPGVDRWILSRVLKLGDDFTDLVERHRRMDVAALGRDVLADCSYEVIWRGGGYVMHGKAPKQSSAAVDR